MIEFDVDMGYLLECDELDRVVLNDENGEHEPMEFVPNDAVTVGVGTCVDKDSDPNDFKCSACGARSFIQANDTYTTILDDHLTVLKKFNYCPNCGKRVIEEVTE